LTIVGTMKLTNEVFLLVAIASLLACEGAKVVSTIQRKSMTDVTDVGVVQKKVVVATVSADVTVVWKDVPGTTNWSGAQALCVADNQRLCTVDEVCPNGNLNGGAKAGDQWSAVAGQDNWIAVGDTPYYGGLAVCTNHKQSPGGPGPPSWTASTSNGAYRVHLPCCADPAPSCIQPPTPADIENITVISLGYDNFDVTVECREAGKFANVTKCAQADGNFTISSCQYPRVCRSPDNVDPAYQSIAETNLSMDNFNVTVVCENGTRAGSAGACLEAGGFYRLFGCEAPVCHRPDIVDPNIASINEHNVMLETFNVTAVCQNSQFVARVEPCQAHNMPYYVHECSAPPVCRPPAILVGAADYDTIENVDLNMASFHVVANCTNPNRVAHVEKCTEPLGEYTIVGCHGSFVCSAPSSVSKAVRTIQEVKLLSDDFDVTVECVHHAENATVTPCIREGEPYQISGCTVTEVPLKWYVADVGNKSCTEVCQEQYQLPCYEDGLAASVNDQQLLMRSFLSADFTCSHYNTDCSGSDTCATLGAPYINTALASGSTKWMDGQGTPCFYGDTAATCDYHPDDTNIRRLCPCEEPLPPAPEVTTTTADPDQCMGTQVHGHLGCDAQPETAECQLLYMCTSHPAPVYEVCNQCVGRTQTGALAFHPDIGRIGGPCGATAKPCNKPPR